VILVLHWSWGLMSIGLAVLTGKFCWTMGRERERRRGSQRVAERPALPASPSHAALTVRQQAAVTAVRLQRPAGALEAGEARRHA
jgi:hypothetical protein